MHKFSMITEFLKIESASFYLNYLFNNEKKNFNLT